MDELQPQNDQTQAAPLFQGRDEEIQAAAPQIPVVNFHATTEDALQATWDQGANERLTSKLSKMWALHQANESGAPKLQPNELNSIYKDSGETFDAPMTRTAAQIIVDRRQEENDLNNIASSGGQSNLGWLAKQAAGLASGSLDPLAIGAGYAGGALLNGAMKAAVATRAAMLGETAMLTEAASSTAAITSRAGIIAQAAKSRLAALPEKIAHGFAGNYLAEPINYMSDKSEGKDYSVEQGFKSALAGAVMFSGMDFAAGHLADHIMARENLHLEIIKSAITQSAQDQRLHLDSGAKTVAQEINYDPKIHNEYDYSPKDSEEMSKSKLYMSGDRIAPDFNDVKSAQFTQKYGKYGVHLTDAEYVANGTSGSSYNDQTNSFFEMKVKDGEKINSLNTNEVIPDNAREALSKATGLEIKPEEKLGDVMGKFRDMHGDYESLSHIDANEVMNDALKSAGYDGIIHHEDNFSGNKINPHNQMYLFDSNKLEQVHSLMPDPEKISRPSQSDIQDDFNKSKNTPQNKIDYNESDAKALETAKQQENPSLNSSESKNLLSDHLQSIDEAIKQGTASPEEKAFLEKTRDAIKQDDLRDTITKAGIECFERV